MDIKKDHYSAHDEGRNGNWMQTYVGGIFYPIDPHLDEICIEDIAHALALQCRYNGHCINFYSVAEHCYWISKLLPPELALAGLLHDASEAYLCDIPRPLKPWLTGYKEAEARLERVIAMKYNLQYPWHDQIKYMDNAMLLVERDQNMARPPRPWHDYNVAAPDIKLNLWLPDVAEQMFLTRFEELT